ncbi:MULTISPECIES: rod shape-determining protein MreC [Comamonadaceae]|uniref:Cell shape-determining protein MreC n=1 Tax=Giesbergeria anulus TaxID=180197 RepID=A0A1H9M773_9BURK|nr:rod shape-determining protein MreC [Giesbergeria anulus]SER19600.1 rod shape-determining protein MreC [Giesbergeria anulus]
MPLGTLDRRAPSLMRQGPSALSQLILYGALALFLMVADARWRVTDPLRQSVAVVLYPIQWLLLQPKQWAGRSEGYFDNLEQAQAAADAAHQQLVRLSVRANQAQELLQENERLRKLLDLQVRLDPPAHAAQILYDTPDPYTRRVVVDRGQVQGVVQGSPVLDEAGVFGQVTRVYPFLSEVTLLVDREQAIPVLNTRTGARGVAYGDPVASHGGGMELRFVAANADVQEDDLLSTSGLDGVYPPGLPVAKVIRVERRADSAFARIYCKPLAKVEGARHVILITPVDNMPTRQPPEPAASPKLGVRR